MTNYWKPHKKKTSAQEDAERLRNKGYTVRVIPATVYSKSRGFRWETKVTGKKK